MTDTAPDSPATDEPTPQEDALNAALRAGVQAAQAPGQQPDVPADQPAVLPGSEEDVIRQAQNPDAVRNLINSEREARRSAEARLRELEEQRSADDQPQEDPAATVRENMRLRVALRKGLTGPYAMLATRLEGESESEMEADADRLLALVTPPADASPPPSGGGVRQSADQPLSMDDRIRQAVGR